MKTQTKKGIAQELTDACVEVVKYLEARGIRWKGETGRTVILPMLDAVIQRAQTYLAKEFGSKALCPYCNHDETHNLNFGCQSGSSQEAYCSACGRQFFYIINADIYYSVWGRLN